MNLRGSVAQYHASREDAHQRRHVTMPNYVLRPLVPIALLSAKTGTSLRGLPLSTATATAAGHRSRGSSAVQKPRGIP
eukprot:COSAG02_NODE_35594_length_466_cov_0.811989_1_plen_77_part_10